MSHNGSVRINREALITPAVDLPQYAHLRAKDYSDRVIHEAGPMTDAERQRQEGFINHSVAQQAAARNGERRRFTNDEALAMRVSAAAQRPQQPASDQASIELVAHVQRLADLVDTQREVIDAQAVAISDLQKRLADLDGNAFVVGESE